MEPQLEQGGRRVMIKNMPQNLAGIRRSYREKMVEAADEQSSKRSPRKTRTFLNLDQVEEIRQIGKRLSVRDLASKFNVGAATIYRVLEGKHKLQEVTEEVTPLPWNLLAAAFALGCIITGIILTFLPIPFTL
jgi:hypothetical protein